MFKHITHVFTVIAVLAMAGLTLPAVAAAQDKAETAAATTAVTQASAKQKQQMQKLLQDYKQTAKQLDAARQQALAANPELVKRRDAFQAMVKARMKKNGYDIDAKAAKLKKLRDNATTKKQQQQLLVTYLQQRKKMQQAQAQVMQSSDVSSAAKKLSQDTLAAMQEQNPKTQEMIDHLKDLLKQRQQILSAAHPQGTQQN